MVTATFRFHEELNDFLAPHRRGREIEAACAESSTVKHMIEALGVPHTEVELVLVNGESVGFERPIADGDCIAVHPRFGSTGVTPLVRLREPPPWPARFVADAHLGGLARLLRMTGFDTLYDNHFADDEIERLAAAEQRIVLTRDRELLMRRTVVHGRHVRALDSESQCREVFARFTLAPAVQPFTRCMGCNGELQPVDKSRVIDRLPPRVREQHQRFSRCSGCGHVYWEGSHWQRMRRLVDALIAGRSDPLALPAA